MFLSKVSVPDTVNLATTSPGPKVETVLVPGATETNPAASAGNLTTTIPGPPLLAAACPPESAPFPVLSAPLEAGPPGYPCPPATYVTSEPVIRLGTPGPPAPPAWLCLTLGSCS